MICKCYSYNWCTGTVKPVTMNPPKSTRTHDIDACIAGTLQKLWDLGIETKCSCCGHGRDNPFIFIPESYSKIDLSNTLKVLMEIDPRDWHVLQWKGEIRYKYDSSGELLEMYNKNG